jgi:hypothetical protein
MDALSNLSLSGIALGVLAAVVECQVEGSRRRDLNVS